MRGKPENDRYFFSKRENKTTYTIVGTPEYQAPEILKGEGHYREVDLYSLGCLIF